jgi:hypothetical protein
VATGDIAALDWPLFCRAMIIRLAVKTGRLEDGGFSKNLQFFYRRCVKASETHRKKPNASNKKGPHHGGLFQSYERAI